MTWISRGVKRRTTPPISARRRSILTRASLAPLSLQRRAPTATSDGLTRGSRTSHLGSDLPIPRRIVTARRSSAAASQPFTARCNTWISVEARSPDTPFKPRRHQMASIQPSLWMAELRLRIPGRTLTPASLATAMPTHRSQSPPAISSRPTGDPLRSISGTSRCSRSSRRT